MNERREHPYVPRLKEQLAEGRIGRREFLRTATLLGVSAGAAYAFAGHIGDRDFLPAARAESMPSGGSLRIGLRVQEVKHPHTYSWQQSEITRQVCEHLTRTGHDNITRPHLVRWEASEDLRTWDLHLREDVKWRSGRPFVADDVVWNLEHVLDPDTGSSVLGLMKSYMMNDEGTALWDASAIEKIDDHHVRLNCKAPQLAVPEHLYHYPLHILDPEEDGVFGVGSNGTGAFELVEIKVGEKAVLKARSGYWGEGPYLDSLTYIDLGDDPSAAIGALGSKQVDGLYEVDISLLDALEDMEHVDIYSAPTAQTGIARMRVTEKPFDDPRVRKAVRLAMDPARVLELAHRGMGLVAEHHHVCPIHPEYAKLPPMKRNVAAAKRLLAEAGYPDGIDLRIDCKNDPAWEPAAVQAMVEQWQEAGIRVAINIMPSAAYWDIWNKTTFGFTGWTHRPLGVMVLGLAYRSGVPWNETQYANPEFDRLLAEAEGILDPEERRPIMEKLERIMQEDGPIAQPLWQEVFSAHDKRVKGFRMHPTSHIYAEQLAVIGDW